MEEDVHYHPSIIEAMGSRQDYNKYISGLGKIWTLRGWHGNALGSPDRESPKFRLDATDPSQLLDQAARVALAKERLIENAEPELQRRIGEIARGEEQAFRKSLGLELSHPNPQVRVVQQGVIDGNLRSSMLLKLAQFYPEDTIERLPESLRTALESSMPGTGYGTAFEHHVINEDHRLAIIEHYFNGNTGVKVVEYRDGEGRDAQFEELTAPEIVSRMEQSIKDTAERMAQYNSQRRSSS